MRQLRISVRMKLTTRLISLTYVHECYEIRSPVLTKADIRELMPAPTPITIPVPAVWSFSRRLLNYERRFLSVADTHSSYMR